MKAKIELCPLCKRKMNPRKVVFCRTLVSVLFKVYEYCKSKNVTQFHTTETKNIMTHAEYARLNDLVRFNLLKKDYSNKHGGYEIDFETVEKYLRGELAVAIYFVKYVGGERIKYSNIRKTIREVKNVTEIIEMIGEKMTEYLPVEKKDEKLF